MNPPDRNRPTRNNPTHHPRPTRPSTTQFLRHLRLLQSRLLRLALLASTRTIAACSNGHRCHRLHPRLRWIPRNRLGNILRSPCETRRGYHLRNRLHDGNLKKEIGRSKRLRLGQTLAARTHRRRSQHAAGRSGSQPWDRCASDAQAFLFFPSFLNQHRWISAS